VVIAGTEKKGTVITEQEKRIIAYHEVGHALAAAKQKKERPARHQPRSPSSPTPRGPWATPSICRRRRSSS